MPIVARLSLRGLCAADPQVTAGSTAPAADAAATAEAKPTAAVVPSRVSVDVAETERKAADAAATASDETRLSELNTSDDDARVRLSFFLALPHTALTNQLWDPCSTRRITQVLCAMAAMAAMPVLLA